MRKKSKRIFGRKISTKDWLKLKPYDTFKTYDQYYVRQAEKVYAILQKFKHRFQNFGFEKQDYSELACVLTSHFEDFINEIGIWFHFQQVNKELYDYPLPFYGLQNYEEDYLNPEDFSYLVWHYASKKGRIHLAPDDPFILEIGQALYDLFEPLIDEAPTTDFYDLYFTIPDDILFFELKSRLKWFSFQSYPLINEFSIDLKRRLDKFLEGREAHFMDNKDSYAYAMEDDYIYNKRSGYSALSTLEWFCGVANCSSDTQLDILQMSKRIMSQFLFEKEEGNYWVFKEMYTDRLFSMRKESVNLPRYARIKGQMQAMTIVPWKEAWWMSGTMMSLGEIPAYKLERMKQEIHNTPFYAYTEEQQTTLYQNTESMYLLFLEYFGTPIVLFEKNNELQKAMKVFGDFCNERQVTDKEAAKKAKEKYDSRYKNLADDKKIENLQFDAPKGVGLIFLPMVGNIIAPNLGEIISLMKAPSINREDTLLLYRTLFSEKAHYFVTNYLLNHYPTHNLKYPIPSSQIDVVKEAHFLNRFLNPNDFGVAIPNIRNVDLSA